MYDDPTHRAMSSTASSQNDAIADARVLGMLELQMDLER